MVLDTTYECEHGHTHYSAEELLSCCAGEHDHGHGHSHPKHTRRASTTSLCNMDSSSTDFWNLTLDDLEISSSSSSSSPIVYPRQERRRSDGMPPMVRRGSCSGRSSKPVKKDMPRRCVSFGNVQVRVCERVLGDNPSCHDGPSLSIGWKYEVKKDVEVDAWEKKRKKERRSHAKLLLSPDKREKIAKRSGFSKEEIQKNVEQVAKHARRRERTRKEFEKDCKANLLYQSNKQSLAKFLQERSSGRSTTRSSASSTSSNSIPSTSLRSMRTV